MVTSTVKCRRCAGTGVKTLRYNTSNIAYAFVRVEVMPGQPKKSGFPSTLSNFVGQAVFTCWGASTVLSRPSTKVKNVKCGDPAHRSTYRKTLRARFTRHAWDSLPTSTSLSAQRSTLAEMDRSDATPIFADSVCSVCRLYRNICPATGQGFRYAL